MDQGTGQRVRGGPRKFLEALSGQLIEYAEHVFRKERKAADGATEGDHQASAARQWALLGRKDIAKRIEPDAPDFPDVVDHVWRSFWEILAGSPVNGMAPSVIGWADMRAWCEITDAVLDPWEARLIIRLSSLRVEIISERLKKQKA